MNGSETAERDKATSRRKVPNVAKFYQGAQMIRKQRGHVFPRVRWDKILQGIRTMCHQLGRTAPRGEKSRRGIKHTRPQVERGKISGGAIPGEFHGTKTKDPERDTKKTREERRWRGGAKISGKGMRQREGC